MPPQNTIKGDSVLSWVPLLLLVSLVVLTVGIWRQQVHQQNAVLSRHTHDVGFQASRRLEIFVDSHIAMASIIASRWSAKENPDISREQFEQFASVLLEEVSGYRSVSLVDPQAKLRWHITGEKTVQGPLEDPAPEGLVREAMRTNQVMVLPPVGTGTEDAEFSAVVPLSRDGQSLGAVLVRFHVQGLLAECFHQRIRSEFNFVVLDDGQFLSGYTPDGMQWLKKQSAIAYSREFDVRNRKWTLSVVPRRSQLLMAGGRSSLPVLLFGIALSTALAILAHLLIRRMAMLRNARDRAMDEIQRRERAQSELVESEDRYHGVFESATDGFIILDGDEIVEANPAACRMHGYTPGALHGLDVRSLISPEHMSAYDEFMGQIRSVGTARVDSLDRRKDGSTLEVEVRGTVLHQEGKNRMLAIITDVSERRRNEQNLATLSRKILVAQEEERRRLSRDLHDELGQMLTAIRLEMDWLQKSGPLEGEASMALERSNSLVEQAANELRRICRGLRPPLLDDLGLEPAVHQLVDEFQSRTDTTVALDIRLDGQCDDIPRETALCIYRILQEALTNISRHSSARKVDISLLEQDGRLTLSVYDDGDGFDVQSVDGKGSGITGMRERAHLVGGELRIRSVIEQGSRIELEVATRSLHGGPSR